MSQRVWDGHFLISFLVLYKVKGILEAKSAIKDRELTHFSPLKGRRLIKNSRVFRKRRLLELKEGIYSVEELIKAKVFNL